MKKYCDNSIRVAGFTLVEMLVVISILLLLIGIAIPAFTGVVLRVHQSQSQAIINQINGAVGAYQMDFSNSPNSPGSDSNGVPPGSYFDGTNTWYGAQAIVLYLTGYHDASGKYGAVQSTAFGWRTNRNSPAYGPYNDTDKLKILPGSILNHTDTKGTLTNYNNTGQPMTFDHMIADQANCGFADSGGMISHPVFLDAFGAPILYFGAATYDSTPGSPTYMHFTYAKRAAGKTGAGCLSDNFCDDGIHNKNLFGVDENANDTPNTPSGTYYSRGDGIDTGVQHTGPGLEVTYQGVHSNLGAQFSTPPITFITNPATHDFYRSDFMLMSAGASQTYGGSVHDDSNNLYGR